MIRGDATLGVRQCDESSASVTRDPVVWCRSSVHIRDHGDRFEQLAAAIQNSQAPPAMKAATKTISTTSTSCAAAAATGGLVALFDRRAVRFESMLERLKGIVHRRLHHCKIEKPGP